MLNKMFKKVLSLLVFTVIIGFSGSAFAANINISLTIGQNVAWVGDQISTLPLAPFETKGTTYVPFRFIGEALGANIDWDNKNKSVTFTTSGHKLTLYVGNKKHYYDGVLRYAAVMPQQKGNYVVVPLRLVSEVLGCDVVYTPLGRVISIKASQPPIPQFDIVPAITIVGQPVQYYEYSYDPDGDSIVDWQWDGRKDTFDTPGTYSVRLRVKDVTGVWSPWTSRDITVNEIPNNPPTASFTVGNTTVDQGETVIYTEQSTDSDGKVVDWLWTGKKKAFFAPGDYVVKLKVKDDRGAWSEPSSVTIHVTDKVLMDEFLYNLTNPEAGEIFPFAGAISDKSFTNLTPQYEDDGNITLFFSNSPENVSENGVLYADDLRGNIRLMYSHQNMSQTRKRFYLIARNTSEEEVALKYLKGGYSGPSADMFGVGAMGIMRYFQSYYDKEVVIPPHKWITLNIGSNELLPTNPGECIYGLYEVSTTAKLRFMAIALDENKNLEDALPTLPVLKRDSHNRGTFNNANRTLTVDAKPFTRVIIGDGKSDPFLMGYDGLSQQVTQNHGNYGVLYDIKIKSGEPLTVIANPRGGGFAGSFSLGGNYFLAPKSGGFAFNVTNMNTMLGTINGDTDMVFIPPASSNLPIHIDFLPRY